MLDATSSGCINHPGVEAITRCKQCSRPVCGACVETSPLGSFCSTVCRDKFHAFVQRAQSLETNVRSTWLQSLKMAAVRLLLIVFLLVIVGLLAIRLDIPVLAEAAIWVRQTIGI